MMSQTEARDSPVDLPSQCPKCAAPWGEGVFCDHCGHRLVLRRYCHTCRHHFIEHCGPARHTIPVVHCQVLQRRHPQDINISGRCMHWQTQDKPAEVIAPRWRLIQNEVHRDMAIYGLLFPLFILLLSGTLVGISFISCGL